MKVTIILRRFTPVINMKCSGFSALDYGDSMLYEVNVCAMLLIFYFSLGGQDTSLFGSFLVIEGSHSWASTVH